jgi:hypothetical protein
MLPDLEGAAQLCAQSSCWYTALMSLGMTLIRANTLSFGLIGKDGPHRIIKICFGNMNLVFGSEVALFGFWEYMFGILVTVYEGLVRILHRCPMVPIYVFPEMKLRGLVRKDIS